MSGRLKGSPVDLCRVSPAPALKPATHQQDLDIVRCECHAMHRPLEHQWSTLGDVATQAEMRDDLIDELDGYLEQTVSPFVAPITMNATLRHDDLSVRGHAT